MNRGAIGIGECQSRHGASDSRTPRAAAFSKISGVTLATWLAPSCRSVAYDCVQSLRLRGWSDFTLGGEMRQKGGEFRGPHLPGVAQE